MLPDVKDFKLTQAEYERFRDFIRDRIGLDFPEDKRHLLTRGLAEVLTMTGCSNLEQLYLMLQGPAATNALWDQVISVLTVGETYFFRNANHWDALRTQMLPELLAQREHSTRRIRIWTAGCATGEEPYSVAMLLRETVPNLDSWNILILATDLNREALRKAREGLYGSWSFRGVDRHIQDTYFKFNGKSYAIDDRIKQMVTFNYLNLVGDKYPSLTNNTNAMDIILCRNVTIYFTPQVTLDVVHRFHETLTDGGWLIPGPSEPNMVYYGDFETRNFPGTVVYQKAQSAALRPAKPSDVFALGPQQVSVFVTNTAAAGPAPRPNGSSLPGSGRQGTGALRSATPAPIPPTLPRLPADPFDAAQQLMQEGRLDEALVKLHEKIERDANFVPTYYTLGKVYANKGNLEEAQAWCEKALQKDKLHAEPYYTLSLIYQEYGLVEQAVEVLKRAVYLDRDFVLAHYTLAQLYQRQGDAVNAQRSRHNALRLLESRPRDQVVPEGDGILVGRLHELIEHDIVVDKLAGA